MTNGPPVQITHIPVGTLLKAYRAGIFPMAHDDGELYWHDPDPRAIFPIHAVAPDKKTAQQLRSDHTRITMDTAFEEVIHACAGREETWIDQRIIRSYLALHQQGHAHSVEIRKSGNLVGGIYGVAIGGAFFGESMFNYAPNMGKVAFHALVQHLISKGYVLFDTQYINPFTQKLGAVEIPREAYQRLLGEAVALPVSFR